MNWVRLNKGKLSAAVFITTAFFLFQNFTFSAQREPIAITDEVFANSLQTLLLSTKVKSLTDPSLREADQKPLVLKTCPNSAQTTQNAFYHNTPLLNSVASSLYSGVIYFQNDNSKKDLTNSLIQNLETIANVTIQYAIQTGPNSIGWNNLSSSWDAFLNGTCSPNTKPNVYASAYGLLNIAWAYQVTQNPTLKSRYLDAFIKGAQYWLDTSSSQNLNSSYTVPITRVAGSQTTHYTYTTNDINSFYAKKPASKIFKNFMIGGQRTDVKLDSDAPSLDAGKILPRPFRFFYTEDDPALVSLNCSGLLGYAFLKMGIVLRNEGTPLPTFTIPLTSTETVQKDLYYIGYWTVYPLYYNLLKDNGSYYDIDSVQFYQTNYEAHLGTITLPTLTKVGRLLNDSTYVNQSIDTMNTFSINIDGGSSASPKILSHCTLKNLQSSSNEVCRNLISVGISSSGVITSDLYLSSSASQLDP